MDDFDFDRPELTGSLISLEFGQGGRIQQLWASDPKLPDEHDEFQFVLGPIQFGGEFADDYLPGTVLLGVRAKPDEPWVLSRNSGALQVPAEEPGVVMFDYDFDFLSDVTGTGRFYEMPGPVPQIVWELRIVNNGRRTVEIGEVALPMALNNFYEGFGASDEEVKRLINDRVHIHKFIGGAASYLLAERLECQSPGLLIYPGTETSWEFFTHVQASLNSGYRWEGIPIVYLHSRAAIEREGWQEWFNGHSSLMLEPGDSRLYETRFAVADTTQPEGPFRTLQQCGRPVFKLFPAAVAPLQVGIGVEIAGGSPKAFATDVPAEVETDADEEGGFCFVKPSATGPVRVSVSDERGRSSIVHLFFTAPIEDLINARAKWIMDNEVQGEESGILSHAIWPADAGTGQTYNSERALGDTFNLASSLSDALFLAGKNESYPDLEQIQALDEYVYEFLRERVQNPGDALIGSAFVDSPIAVGYSAPHLYPLAMGLYLSMGRIAAAYGGTRREAAFYLREAHRTAIALLDRALPLSWRRMGLPGMSWVDDVIVALDEAGMAAEAEDLEAAWRQRAETLLEWDAPFIGEFGWDTAGFEEIAAAARFLSDQEHLDEVYRLANAARSLGPSWWWYGSDRQLGYGSGGELCLGNTTVSDSVIFFDGLDRDYEELPEGPMRLAFGGMLGVWALVREDGSASMCFCPDAGARDFGFSRHAGNLGAALYSYMRHAGSYVLPTPNGIFTFGCHFGLEDESYSVRPWDGLGRRIVMRQIGAAFELRFGRIVELRLDQRKRWARLTVENPSDRPVQTVLKVRGLWGERLEAFGQTVDTMEGEATVPLDLPAGRSVEVELKVKS